MISNILLYIFLLHDTPNVDLLGLLELIFLLLLDVLLNHGIDLSTCHIVLYFLCQLIEDALVLDDHPQKSLLEFIICQSDFIVFVHLLVLSEVPEYLGELLRVGDERVYLEDEVKVVPSLEDYL